MHQQLVRNDVSEGSGLLYELLNVTVGWRADAGGWRRSTASEHKARSNIA
jgi:hypothetical protein